MADTGSRGEGTRVAVIGTGIMGAAMASNLIGAGLPTTVWERSRDATAPLADAGRTSRPRSWRCTAAVSLTVSRRARCSG
jgi:3-hydroxyisobutyrate dehydrogenase-like beta-hydroxyacid dehydrogenase